jgi:hypothetical protein
MFSSGNLSIAFKLLMILTFGKLSGANKYYRCYTKPNKL